MKILVQKNKFIQKKNILKKLLFLLKVYQMRKMISSKKKEKKPKFLFPARGANCTKNRGQRSEVDRGTSLPVSRSVRSVKTSFTMR